LIWRLRKKRLQDGRAMKNAALFLILSSLMLVGCHTAKKVAVTSFRVVDAPARFIRDRIDSGETTTTTTTTTTAPSDVTNPGYPVTQPPPAAPPTRQTVTRPSRTTSTAAVTQASPAAQRRPSPSASPRPAATQPAQFPVARPVPGRPGYVYSLDPNGGMIDVTGYKPGDKAKDPYTKQIFIVP
jgi:hypothetical protein